MILLIIVPIILGVIYLYNIYQFNYWKRKGVKQSIPLTPFGDYADVLVKGYNFSEMIQRVYNRFQGERYSGSYLFFDPVLILRDPELIKELCIKNFEHFINHKPFQSDHADPIWNKNLLALRGEQWKHMRYTLSPAFTGSKLRQMFIFTHEYAESFVKYFLKSTEDIQEVEFKEYFEKYSNDIIATTSFGIKCDSLNEPDNEFFMKGKHTTDFSGLFKSITFQLTKMMPLVGKVLKASLFEKKTLVFFKRILQETLEYRVKNNFERSDMVDLLMHASKRNQNDDGIHVDTKTNNNDEVKHYEDKHSNIANSDLSFDDMTAQALIFFFAGFETVSSSACFMAYELAVNPDIQQRLIDELDEYKESNSTLTYEALSKLTYLDMIVSETMRKWPHFMAVDRQCVKPYTIATKKAHENKVDLVEGDVLWIPIYGIHRDPQYWENPEKFDPERFAPENKHKIIPYTYLPFGFGPRRCIAERFAIIELKVLFYELLTHFEIVPSKKCVPFVPCTTPFFSITFSDGFPLGLKKRNVSNL